MGFLTRTRARFLIRRAIRTGEPVRLGEPYYLGSEDYGRQDVLDEIPKLMRKEFAGHEFRIDLINMRMIVWRKE